VPAGDDLPHHLLPFERFGHTPAITAPTEARHYAADPLADGGNARGAHRHEHMREQWKRTYGHR
jgi:hypothetical protein